jgi:hypothetical protein
MTNDISSSSETPAPTLTSGSVPRAARWRRLGLPWLLLAALVVAAAIVVPVVVLSASHRAGPAGGDSGAPSSPQTTLYREQVTTTISRLLAAEASVASGSAPHLDPGNVGPSVSKDPAINGSGTLRVTIGEGGVSNVRLEADSGGTFQLKQVAWSVSVTSPYASSRFAVWDIRKTDSGQVTDNRGSCVLSSTLLGPGPAKKDLELGSGRTVQLCKSTWLGPGPVSDTEPSLSSAGISAP